MILKDRYLIDREQIQDFKYCPYCGSETVYVHEGNQEGYTGCLDSSCSHKMHFDVFEAKVEHNTDFRVEMRELLDRERCEVCGEWGNECYCHDEWCGCDECNAWYDDEEDEW